MYDHKLLQELNLTAWQPCRAPVVLYISSNKFCCLANEGLVHLTVDVRHHAPDVIHYSGGLPIVIFEIMLLFQIAFEMYY